MEPMEGSGGGNMSPARVKEEPSDAAIDHDVREESELMDIECVKTEPSWSDSAASCGVSEAAALAGLYTDHIFEDDLVLGPETPYRPDGGLQVIEWAVGDADGQPISDCDMSLTSTQAPIPRASSSSDTLGPVSIKKHQPSTETLQGNTATGTRSPGHKPEEKKRHRAGRKKNRGSRVQVEDGTWFRLPRFKPKPKPTQSPQRLSCARGRSVTPGPEDRPLTSEAANEERDVFVEPEPKLWKPPKMMAHEINRLPGGSMRLAKVPITLTPEASIRVKTELEQSIYMSAAERAEACDLDGEDGDEIVIENYDHVSKWFSVSELPPPDTMDIRPPPSKPVLNVDGGSLSGTASVHAVEQPQPWPSGTQGGLLPSFEHVGERESASEKVVKPQRHTRVTEDDGSDFDSDFDDEFDLNEIPTITGIARGIPDDDDLEEPVANIINSVERAMDEAVDRLINVSTDFQWQVDFDTFRGVPENFSGPTPGSVKDYDTPYDAFTDIWSSDIMEHIARETNRYAKQEIDSKIAAGTLSESSRLRRWKDTDADELYVLFSAYILMGIDPRSSLREYFATSGYLEMPKFRSLFTYDRFLLLSKFLHFADNWDASPELQSEGDMLSPKLRRIAPVLSHLNAKFQSKYVLHRDVAIDESLTLFMGRLSWIQGIRSKAARFGIKSYELCESRTGYLYKFNIYTGKSSDRGNVTAPCTELADESTQAVLDLLKGLELRGHCVTMDNFYNSPALARYLKSLGFDCLGTLRPNRSNVPEEIAKAPKNVPKGTIIALHSGDVSCLAWKDTKMVSMISTYHNAETFVGRKAGRELVKPVAVRDYNNTMGGVDLKDQKLSMYLTERCLKWYMKMFIRLLNVSVHNALILLLSSLKRRSMPEITHREFRETLANSLVAAHRPSLREISAVITEDMRLRRDIVHVPQVLNRKTRVHCALCRRKDITKLVSTKCVTCDEGMCFEGCWSDWHSLQRLPGRHVFVRKARRRPNRND